MKKPASDSSTHTSQDSALYGGERVVHTVTTCSRRETAMIPRLLPTVIAAVLCASTFQSSCHADGAEDIAERRMIFLHTQRAARQRRQSQARREVQLIPKSRMTVAPDQSLHKRVSGQKMLKQSYHQQSAALKAMRYQTRTNFGKAAYGKTAAVRSASSNSGKPRGVGGRLGGFAKDSWQKYMKKKDVQKRRADFAAKKAEKRVWDRAFQAELVKNDYRQAVKKQAKQAGDTARARTNARFNRLLEAVRKGSASRSQE